MEFANQNLTLLGRVVPFFQDGAGLASSRSAPESSRWMFFTELSTELLTLQMQLPDLIRRFHKPSMRPGVAEEECGQISRELLTLFEMSCTDKNPKESLNGPQALSYPCLEELRRGRNTDPERCIIPYGSVSGGENLLKEFKKWNGRLGRLVRSPYYDSKDKGERPTRPSWNVRELAKKLHAITKEFWNCTCPGEAHDYMLFLSTQRTFTDSHPYICFDMLFNTPGAGSESWKESRVWTMIPGNESSRAAPPTKRQVPALCRHVSQIRPQTRVNVRLQDSKIYHTRPTASKLNQRGGSPTATLEDIISGPAILSIEGKLILAVLLAYSVLYHCGSDWLPSGWDKRSFRFLKCQDDFEFLWPLLSAGIPSSKYPNRNIIPGDIHTDIDRLQLGVLLLEIFLKKRIEDFREDEDVYDGVVTTDTNFYTACRVHDEYDWDVHEQFKNAIAACLDCEVETFNTSFDNIDYCTFIYDQVIQPLEKELTALCRISSEKLDDLISRSGPRTTTPVERNGRPTTQHNTIQVTEPSSMNGSAPQLSTTGFVGISNVDVHQITYPTSAERDQSTASEALPGMSINLSSLPEGSFWN
jgi:hypothetical protein